MSGPAAVLGESLGALERALRGPFRQEVIDRLTGDRGGSGAAVGRLRSMMSAHTFRGHEVVVGLDRLVQKLDHRTRQDGFRVLHNWDHNTHEFTEEIVPVLLLDHHERVRGERPVTAVEIGILLDYYFLHVLALCAMRVWDHDDPDAALDRVTDLVEDLQGESGSGHQFLDDGETLIIYALSQFHPEEQAYDRLIERIGTLSDVHRTAFAMPSVSVLSAHLRWGFWLMYERDVLRMRNDNVGDYPWLLDSVVTLLRDYARLHDDGATEDARSDVVAALLQGFAADPWAFTGKAPPALADYAAVYDEMRRLLDGYGADLLSELEHHKPSKDVYSPLSLHFNFPHNTLVATVAMALLDGAPHALSLNTLFRQALRPTDPPGKNGPGEGNSVEAGHAQEEYARALMAYSGASPDRLGYQGALLVAYDPLSGLRCYSMTVDALRESLV